MRSNIWKMKNRRTERAAVAPERVRRCGVVIPPGFHGSRLLRHPAPISQLNDLRVSTEAIAARTHRKTVIRADSINRIVWNHNHVNKESA